ncbi:MAG: lysostaphin resistance A-like protein [Vicinamibacterales bacterium]
MMFRVLVGSVPVIAILVAAAFVTPPGFPLLLRQVLLCVIGVAGIATAEALFFGGGGKRTLVALGFVVPRATAVWVAVVVSLPMWLFLPLHGWLTHVPVTLNEEWLSILLGVILVNGVSEEVIHRAFVFGHLRETRGFWASATISAAVFAAQHTYLLATMGAVAGGASMALALAVAFPLALLYERGGHSIGGPAILHTSSNAPMLLFVPPEAASVVLLPHMAVVLASMYLSFALRPWLR